MTGATSIGAARRVRRSTWRGGPLALGLLAGLLATAALAQGVPPLADDDETPQREVYVPHPEFRPYPDREQLALDGVTLIRVQRADRSEALVAKEDTGWEHVILEGSHLAFYSLGRQPLRRAPGRSVILREWSGGAHCCFDYHVLRVEGLALRREGTIRGGDCELRVADLDGDGSLELVACDARFAYAFDLPFSESPLPPMVYTFRDRSYVADNRKYPQVFRYRIAQERRRLAVAARTGDAREARRAVISLLLHHLYAGRVTEGWCGFEQGYAWADRAAVRQEVVRRLRMAPDPDEARVPVADLGYTLAPPGRCP